MKISEMAKEQELLLNAKVGTPVLVHYFRGVGDKGTPAQVTRRKTDLIEVKTAGGNVLRFRTDDFSCTTSDIISLRWPSEDRLKDLKRRDLLSKVSQQMSDLVLTDLTDAQLEQFNDIILSFGANQ
jgi:hypothetical protein